MQTVLSDMYPFARQTNVASPKWKVMFGKRSISSSPASHVGAAISKSAVCKCPCHPCPKGLESKLNILRFNLQKRRLNRLWFKPSQEKLFPTCIMHHASCIMHPFPATGLRIQGLQATDGAPRDLKGQRYGEKWIWSQNAGSWGNPYTFWTLLLKRSGSCLT